MNRKRIAILLLLVGLTFGGREKAFAAAAAAGPLPGELFHHASELARGGEYPKAIEIYRQLASSGAESASLYWNWSKVASARGSHGEALWALLRAREIEPGDRALVREIERLREASNLDPAEISPEPLSALARNNRRFHLDLAVLLFAGLSLAFHLLARSPGGRGSFVGLAWGAFSLSIILALFPLAASLARPTGVVVRRNAPMADSASPTAEVTGSLREGEVVPILGISGMYARVEDSSGARGWALAEDVRRIDRTPGQN